MRFHLCALEHAGTDLLPDCYQVALHTSDFKIRSRRLFARHHLELQTEHRIAIILEVVGDLSEGLSSSAPCHVFARAIVLESEKFWIERSGVLTAGKAAFVSVRVRVKVTA